MVTNNAIMSGGVHDINASTMESMDCSGQRSLGAPTNLTETSDVSQNFLIKEGMTKSKGGSGHITYFIRTPNIPEFGWKWSVPGRDHWEPKSHDRIYIYEGCISILELLTPMNVNHVMKTKKSA